MKTLKDFDFKNKKVLLRCDFNVPLSKTGEILDDFRIKETLKTIEYLINSGAIVILMSHLGRPQKIEDEKLRKESLTMALIKPRLEELLNREIKFLTDLVSEETKEKINQISPGEVALLENIRFYKEEEAGDPVFAEKLAGLADIYINDAFGACHRAHASVSGITKFLPSGAGFLLQREIEVLTRVLENPIRPLVAIIGGSKIDTKIKLINQFLKKADYLILGSKPGLILLIAKKVLSDKVFPEKEEVLKEIEKIDLNHPKLVLPKDGQISLNNENLRIGKIETIKAEEDIFDIGPESIDNFIEIIKSAGMIVWNGPLGMFETKPFDQGTVKLAKAIVENSQAFKIIGGGDTVSAVSELNLLDKFDHVSTGGGAMLEFLSGDILPGVDSLN